ncbi:MAG: hypothetical protein JKX94_01185 [Sneathiella sp.]|nr:hypothetical protein [Sneathiella sp.]
MYLKILSGLTATFLAVLFVVMAQTVPTATAFNGAGAHLSIIKAHCQGDNFLPSFDLKSI